MKNITIILNLPIMLSIVGEVIHEAPLAMVERVSFLQLFCCLDVNQISSIFHNKIAFVEWFHSLKKNSVKYGYNTKSIKLSTHLDAATLVLNGSNLEPMFWIICDSKTGVDGLQPSLLLHRLGLSGAAAEDRKSLKSHLARFHELDSCVEIFKGHY